MSKHFSCKDCCKYQTDACDNPKYAEIGKHLCSAYVLDIEECYQKGREEAIEEIMKECERFRNQFKSFYYMDFLNICRTVKEKENG